MFSMQFIFVIIGYFDKNGSLIKYYPYRSNALSFLLMLVILGKLLYHFMSRKDQNLPSALRKVITFVIILLFLFFVGFYSYGFATRISEGQGPDQPALEELAEYLKNHTEPSDVIISYGGAEDYISLVRLSERDQFVIQKFIPTTSPLIYEWYRRMQDHERFLLDPSYLNKMDAYRIDYVLALCETPIAGLSEVFRNQRFILYRVAE
jgi:hypothetical protein